MIRFRFDGRGYEGHPGDTLASALLALAVGLVVWSLVGGRPAPAPVSPDAPTTPVGTQ